MRWLAIAHWTPFAVMIISLALLGHGASGTALSLWREPARRHFERLFPACAALFTLSAVAALWCARAVPFNGLELVWNPWQLLWLSALYLLLALPFFFAASCFGLAFARHGERIPALYGADLLGAGIGALAAVALLLLPVYIGLLLAACGGLLAAALTVPRRTHLLALVVIAIAVLALLPGRTLTPLPNEFKGLSKALLLPDARVIAERHGPQGWLAVLESPQVPLRHAPGLSLGNVDEPPPQLGLFTDGDGLSPIGRKATPDALAWLGRMTSALPYRLRTDAAVLVLGAGGGQDILQALTLDARTVDAVESNPQRLRMVRDGFADYSGDLYADPRVQVRHAQPRAFVQASEARFDLIVLASDESFASGGAGVQAVAEQYALTVEALRDYRARLAPGGLIAITRWSKHPPRDELKLFATALAALRADGVDKPAAHIAAIRNWDASTWLIGHRRFDADDIASLRAFADEHGFDLVHHAGLQAQDATRFHGLDQPYLFEGTQALASTNADAYLRDYKFAIAPATDDRPYFGNFFRWRSLPELWRLREQGSAVLLDSGYLLLLGTLLQALPLSLLLVLVPLLALPRARRDRNRNRNREGVGGLSRLRAGSYFLALGLAFMLIEIASLSRLTLLVGHPLLAVTVGLAGFLLFAGAGSQYAQRLLNRAGAALDDAPLYDAALARMVRWAVLAIALGLLWQLAVFALALELGGEWSTTARASVGLLGIAPLAFAMGLPFSLGLARLARSAPAFVAWAWGLNGCASVIAAITALLLAMAIGLRATLLCALVLYGFAAWVWRGQSARPA